MVTTKKAIKPVTASLSGSSYDGTEMIDYLTRNQEKLVVVDGEKICAACGFQGQSYFTKAFRERTGTTPGKFREGK